MKPKKTGMLLFLLFISLSLLHFHFTLVIDQTESLLTAENGDQSKLSRLEVMARRIQNQITNESHRLLQTAQSTELKERVRQQSMELSRQVNALLMNLTERQK
jgi:hypothetical protein